MLQPVLVSLHLAANLVWIGAAICVAYLAQAKGGQPWALRLHQKLANPAFFVSFAAGLCVVLLNPSTYMKAHWFHGKLTVALAVLAIHHILAAKVKKAGGQEVAIAGTLGFALAGGAVLSVVLAVFKQLLIP